MFKLLSEEAKLPSYAYPDDAGFDIATIEKKMLGVLERYFFKTGLAIEIPHGWFVSLRDKSGIAGKQGLHVLAGVIDSGYRGELKVLIVNLSPGPVTIEAGQKIAQGILQPAPQADIMEADALSETARGGDGFGSTGR